MLQSPLTLSVQGDHSPPVVVGNGFGGAPFCFALPGSVFIAFQGQSLITQRACCRLTLLSSAMASYLGILEAAFLHPREPQFSMQQSVSSNRCSLVTIRTFWTLLKKFIYLFIFFLSLLGLRCCICFSVIAASRGYSPEELLELLTVVASLVLGRALGCGFPCFGKGSRLCRLGSSGAT